VDHSIEAMTDAILLLTNHTTKWYFNYGTTHWDH
jgi:hypothetical protein